MTTPARRFLRKVRIVTQTLSWACLALSGIFGLIWTPTTVQQAIGTPLTYVWLVMTTVGGVACTLASLFRWREVEKAASLLVIGGLIAYSLSVWTILVEGETTRIVQAMVVTALVALVTRSWAEVSDAPPGRLWGRRPRKRVK